MVAAKYAERRIAPDGKAYARDDFLDYWGAQRGAAEWNSADVAEVAAELQSLADDAEPVGLLWGADVMLKLSQAAKTAKDALVQQAGPDVAETVDGLWSKATERAAEEWAMVRSGRPADSKDQHSSKSEKGKSKAIWVALAFGFIPLAIWYLRRPSICRAGQVPQSFEKSNYKAKYVATAVVTDVLTAMTRLNAFVNAVAENINATEAEAAAYRDSLTQPILAGQFSTVGQLASFLWTTDHLFKGRELCSFINEAVRTEDGEMFDAVIPVCRMLNGNLVVRGGAGPTAYPPNNTTHRGLGMPACCRAFFIQDKTFRVPNFFATSFTLETALDFAGNNSSTENLPTRFEVEFDPPTSQGGLGCKHANYLDGISGIPGEHEFLMPPYSAFTVVADPFELDGIWVIRIRALHDNLLAEANIPVAPWV